VSMTLTDVKELICEGENEQIEFKRKVTSPERIARSLSAFANSGGGFVLFGIDDDGSIIGIDSEKSVTEEILLAGNQFCDPPIDPIVTSVECYGREVIVVEVLESKQKPVYVWDQEKVEQDDPSVYIRIGDKSVIASDEARHLLEAGNSEAPPLRISVGEYERQLFEYLENHGKIDISGYMELAAIPRRKALRTLIHLTRAGVLKYHFNEKGSHYTLA